MAYVGNHYEWNVAAATFRRYYYAGGQRGATRNLSMQNFMLSDHLGSNAVVADTNGVEASEVRYKPWGEDRYTSGTTPTTFKFTGQRQEASIGLYFYGARWYDPALGRFVSADTIVPGGVQGFDRYSYVFNNPLRYTDPSGHNPKCGPDGVYCDNNQINDLDYYPIGNSGYDIGFENTYVKILIVLIAMESSSGIVPDYVSYMKAWALLNIRSYHRSSGLSYYGNLTPFQDWHNHESGLLSQYGIDGTLDEQMEVLLARYESYLSGNNSKISAERFAEIAEAVMDAGMSWFTFGRNSSADPVNGATGFWDAKGMHYPDGKDIDPLLQDIPNYERDIMTNYDEMWRFRNVFGNALAVSLVYQYSIWAESGSPIYTFTVFHCPCD